MPMPFFNLHLCGNQDTPCQIQSIKFKLWKVPRPAGNRSGWSFWVPTRLSLQLYEPLIWKSCIYKTHGRDKLFHIKLHPFRLAYLLTRQRDHLCIRSAVSYKSYLHAFPSQKMIPKYEAFFSLYWHTFNRHVCFLRNIHKQKISSNRVCELLIHVSRLGCHQPSSVILAVAFCFLRKRRK